MKQLNTISWLDEQIGREINISSYVENFETYINISNGADDVTIPYRQIRKVVSSIRHILDILEYPSE